MAKNQIQTSVNNFLVGCTNPQALNFNPNATIPCIDCCVFGTTVPINTPIFNNEGNQTRDPVSPINECPKIQITLNGDVVIENTNRSITKECCDFYGYEYIGDKCVFNIPINEECDIENEFELVITLNGEVKFNNRDLSKVCCEKFGYNYINNKCFFIPKACDLTLTDVIITTNNFVLDKNNRDLDEICCLALGYNYINNRCVFIKPICDLNSEDIIILQDKSLFNNRDGVLLDKECCDFYGFQYDLITKKCFQKNNDFTTDCIEINLSNNPIDIGDCGDVIIELDFLLKDLKINQNVVDKSSCGRFIPINNNSDGYVIFGNLDFTVPIKQPFLSEECCLAYGYTYDSKLKRCRWDQTITKNINATLIEFDNSINIENKVDYNSNQNGLDTWVRLSGSVSNQIEGFNLGLKLCGIDDCTEYEIFIDNIKILCVNNDVEEKINKFDCTGFKLKKVVDNKKSWVYNTGETINRVFAPSDDADLKWRYTDYLQTSGSLEKHSKLVLNTKEVDLLFDFSCLNKCEGKYSGDTKLNLYDLVNYKNTFKNFWFNFAEQFIPSTTVFVSGEKYSNSCDLDDNKCDTCVLPSVILNGELNNTIKTEENCFCVNTGTVSLVDNLTASKDKNKCVKTPLIGEWLSQKFNNDLGCDNVIISDDLFIIIVSNNNISFNRPITQNFNKINKINRIPTNFIRKEVILE